MPYPDARNPPCPWCGSAATRLMTVAVNLFVPLYSCLNCDRFWRHTPPPPKTEQNALPGERADQHS
jgi:hypothetical protein